MKKFAKLTIVALAMSVLALGLSSCKKEEAVEKVGKEIDKAVDTAKQEVEKAGEKAKEAIKK
jgi:hypothetical protein